MAFIDYFLGGMFTTYGVMAFDISNQDPEDRDDPMNLVFPKVAKCTFTKFGPSGTIQVRDGSCNPGYNTERSEFEDGLGSGDFVSGYSYHMSCSCSWVA
jgi:hypothetical protein